MAAIAVLGAAGLALLQLVSGATSAAERARQHEQVMAQAEQLLVTQVLLDRRDLDRRLGVRTHEALFVDVRRPERNLYRIAVGEMRAPKAELLVTVVWRPGSGDGAP